eukprot:TRINITY_DN5628_c0_g1_i1.p1 TRINITY_DN5628_c0_g1~~TRINITY_DN5628_c0_g1_i1.p1  ORF type:complete len:309 (+),score=65.70 TRINITY_DN5628_c0_g1_i1:29-955(+)
MAKITSAMAYATQKTIVIYSPFLTLLRWFFRLCIIGYFAWIMYYRQSYQVPHQGNGFVSIKTKGVSFQKGVENITIWDGMDSTYPSQEKSAVFITASYLRTANQTRGTCDSFKVCNSSSDCTRNLSTKVAIQTGECVNKRCQVSAWCPLESEINDGSPLEGIEDIRIAMKSFANFQGTGVKRHDKKDMKMSVILEKAGVSVDSVKVNGSVVAININWDCNFDYMSGECKPGWTFIRLDDVDSSSSGYNFRYVRPYRIGNGEVVRRDLLKVYGLRIIILSRSMEEIRHHSVCHQCSFSVRNARVGKLFH